VGWYLHVADVPPAVITGHSKIDTVASLIGLNESDLMDHRYGILSQGWVIFAAHEPKSFYVSVRMYVSRNRFSWLSPEF